MTITLRTALPELYNDLCEVIRLFYGECEIHEDADGEILRLLVGQIILIFRHTLILLV